jgi:ComF family protein
MSVPPAEVLRSLVAGLADLIWPRACFLCAHHDDAPGCLCVSCRAELLADRAETCPRCASTVGPYTDTSGGCPSCRGTKFQFGAALRLGPYDGRLREVVLRLKHQSGEALAEELGRAWAIARGAQLTAHQPAAVIPIPLHWRRRWWRGYNQSEAVARGVAAVLNLPCRTNWLVRARPTPSQRAQSAAARWENVRGAFRVRRGVRIPGDSILLIDDVLTTGATADAAAGALRQAGAAQVLVAVLAHR